MARTLHRPSSRQGHFDSNSRRLPYSPPRGPPTAITRFSSRTTTPLIGGLSGASRAGLEPTYYWEAVTPDVLDWLNSHTEPGHSVAFVFPAITFEYLNRWNRLRPRLPASELDDKLDWFVVMNRPGHLAVPPKTWAATCSNTTSQPT